MGTDVVVYRALLIVFIVVYIVVKYIYIFVNSIRQLQR